LAKLPAEIRLNCNTAAFFLLQFLYDHRRETIAKRMQQWYRHCLHNALDDKQIQSNKYTVSQKMATCVLFNNSVKKLADFNDYGS